MSVWKRHARYYLTLIQSNKDAWQWIEVELAQIRRAWAWVSGGGDEKLVPDYIRTFFPFQERRGLWREAVAWGEQGLAVARALANGDQVANVILGNLGLAYYHLGEMHKAMSCYEQALRLARQAGDS